MGLFDIWIYLDSNLNCHFQRILLDWLQPLYFYNSISWVVDKPNIQLDSPKRLWHEVYLICMLAIRTKKINEQAADWSLSPGTVRLKLPPYALSNQLFHFWRKPLQLSLQDVFQWHHFLTFPMKICIFESHVIFCTFCIFDFFSRWIAHWSNSIHHNLHLYSKHFIRFIKSGWRSTVESLGGARTSWKIWKFSWVMSLCLLDMEVCLWPKQKFLFSIHHLSIQMLLPKSFVKFPGNHFQNSFKWLNSKVGCIFPMIISSHFCMRQQRDDDHREDAPTLENWIFKFLPFHHCQSSYQ